MLEFSLHAYWNPSTMNGGSVPRIHLKSGYKRRRRFIALRVNLRGTGCFRALRTAAVLEPRIKTLKTFDLSVSLSQNNHHISSVYITEAFDVPTYQAQQLKPSLCLPKQNASL